MITLKKVITVCIFHLLALFAIAQGDEALSPNAKKSVAHERRRAYLKMSPAEREKYDGGTLFQVSTGRVVCVVNAQKIVDISAIGPMIDGYRVAMGLPLIPIDYEGSKGVFDAVKHGFSVTNAAAVLVLADDTNAPRILCAPEEPWAAVNVRALSVDNPVKEKLNIRVMKESWRALSIAMGAAETLYRPCLLSPIHSLQDLDENPSLVVSPEPFTFISRNARKLGISKIYQTTYRKACRQGWAPAPTNEVQKAIWDEIHTLPTAPIKIVPESQRK